MKNVIYIRSQENSREFSTHSFYNYLLPELHEYYRRSKQSPIFSIEKAKRISPLVIPNLIGLGFYLRTFHKEPIRLLMNYEPKLLYYLTQANFF